MKGMENAKPHNCVNIGKAWGSLAHQDLCEKHDSLAMPIKTSYTKFGGRQNSRTKTFAAYGDPGVQGTSPGLIQRARC